MTKRKVPLRKCVGCNESKPKKELVRIVKEQGGNIKVDSTGRAPGRGAYICNDIDCLETALKGKKLHKSFEMNISDELIEKLSAEIMEKLNAK